MLTTPITGTASEVLVEQLVASGIRYVFYNSGSREALFFDALNSNPNIDGILALHEGSVASMAGAYTQVNSEPAVMVVHLGAGLAQCMGQLYNIWFGGLPVVVITFAGDTGSLYAIANAVDPFNISSRPAILFSSAASLIKVFLATLNSTSALKNSLRSFVKSPTFNP